MNQFHKLKNNYNILIINILFYSKESVLRRRDMMMGGYYPFVIMIIWLLVGIAGARM